MLVKMLRRKCFSQQVKYKQLNNQDILYFRSIFETDNNSQTHSNNSNIETDNLDIYNKDWLKKYIGCSQLVLKPETTEQVSKILKYCNANSLPIVPQSGNTGLVGGSVPINNEIILSMKKMNKIISYNNNVLHCEAGCILNDLDVYLKQYNKIMPLDLAAKGSCLIGGNIATSAGGIHFIKYGSIKHKIKELKVVLADGSIITLDDSKQNEYLKQLFIGSEGTLGIITECKIVPAELYKHVNVAIIGINNFEEIIKLYLNSVKQLDYNLTAIEYFDNECLKLVNSISNSNNSNNDNSIFSKQFPLYLLIERSSNDQNNFDEFCDFLDVNLNANNDCVVSQDETTFNKLWSYREKISESSSKQGICFKYDVSLNLQNFSELIEVIKNKIQNKAIVLSYGHVGDYNLHLNVCYDKFIKDENYKTIENILEPYIFEYLNSINGSISAEHGVGQAKAKYLNLSQSQTSINTMKNIKLSLDKNLILNPGKVLKF